MMRPIPYPILAHERQDYVMRAHRMRSTAIVDLIRDFARWLSVARRQARR